MALLLVAPAAASASPGPFTWTGTDAANGNGSWSNGANWGGTAPAGDVSGLVFPDLPACAPGSACYLTNNNGQVTSTGGIIIDDTDGYVLSGTGPSGTALHLGSVGITGTPSTHPHAIGASTINQALTLTAPQTWAIDGGGIDVGAGGVGGDQPLTLDLTNGGFVSFDGDAEVGPVTATGAGSIELFNTGFSPAALNASDGDRVELTSGTAVRAQSPDTSIGSLQADSGSTVDPGYGRSPDGTLAVTGTAALSSGSTFIGVIDQMGTTPSTDFSQITATGTVALGGTLQLRTGVDASGACNPPAAGDTATLISAPTGVSGAFANAPNGGIVTMAGCSPQAAGPQAQITYSPQAVTATIIATTISSVTPSPATTNQPVTITATVTGAAGAAGTIAFANRGALIAGCTAQPVGPGGTATCATSFAASTSPESVTATFTPSAGSGSSVSAPVALAVLRDSTTTAVTASASTVPSGARVTLTAPVAAAHPGATAPTGTVKFADGGTAIPGCASSPVAAGRATCSAALNAAGAHVITAAYSGNGDFGASTSPATTVSVSPPTARLGRIRISGDTARIPVVCRGGAGTRCALTLTFTGTELLRGGRVIGVIARKSKSTKKVVTLGRRAISVPAGRSQTVPLGLNRAGRQLLSARHRLAVRLTASTRNHGRSTTVASRTLTFTTPARGKMRR